MCNFIFLCLELQHPKVTLLSTSENSIVLSLKDARLLQQPLYDVYYSAVVNESTGAQPSRRFNISYTDIETMHNLTDLLPGHHYRIRVETVKFDDIRSTRYAAVNATASESCCHFNTESGISFWRFIRG